MVNLHQLGLIAESEFADVVQTTEIIRDKLRVLLNEGSYIDFGGQVKFRDDSPTIGSAPMLMGRSIAMTTCRT